MILGVDCSTSKIGIALLNKDEKIIISEVVILNKHFSLEERAWNFKDKIKEIKNKFCIDSLTIVMEEPFVNFKGGGGSAKTTAILHRFNGMICYILYDLFHKLPILISPRTARSKLGIKPSRKVSSQIQKKKPIIDYVSKKYGIDFIYELTPKGNPRPGTDDRADAIVLCLAYKHIK